MLRRIELLASVQLRESFGWNAARYGRDKREKRRLILTGSALALAGLVLMFYMALLAFSFEMLGIGEATPIYAFTAVSAAAFMFTLFRAGDVIFSLKNYERIIALPVKPIEIVVSRFLTMYVFNIAACALMTLPGVAIYALYEKPAASFYIMELLCIFLLPLLPMSAATAISVAVFAAASKMRHKNAASIILSLLFTMAALIGPSMLSAGVEGASEAEIRNLIAGVSGGIAGAYPPAALFSRGAVQGDWLAFAAFAAISAAFFAVVLLAAQMHFADICSALNASTAKRDYVLSRLNAGSPLLALYRKELKRYFASTIYVLNTSIGYILLVIVGAAALALDTEKLAQELGGAGMMQKLLPMGLSLLCVMASPTSCSISMEGRQWWIIQSLPVKTKTVFDSKILADLTVALPCWFVGELLLTIGLKMSLLEYIWVWLLPLVYTLFAAVAGITVNAKLPLMNWETETAVVKQSTATLVFLLTGFVSAGIPLALTLLLPADMNGFVYPAAAVVVLALTVLLYYINRSIKLVSIN